MRKRLQKRCPDERPAPPWQYEVVMSRIGPVVLALLLAACGMQMLDPDGGTPTPSPSPLPPDVRQIRPDREQTMEAGRYSDREFSPRLSFEVPGDAWFTVQRVRGFFDIQRGDLDSPDVIAVQFARPDAIHGEDGAVTPSDAADAAEVLASNSSLTVVETSTSEIGGLEGSQVTVENTGDRVVNFMQLPPGRIALDEGRRLWVAFFDTDAGLLAVMVGGSIERWDETLAAAEPVLESITFEPSDPSSAAPVATRMRARS